MKITEIKLTELTDSFLSVQLNRHFISAQFIL